MKIRTFLAFMLILHSASTFAEWTLVVKSAEESYYLDIDSIEVDGYIAKAKTYMNFPNAGKDGALSISALTEYDCNNQKLRERYITMYEKHDLAGDIINAGEVDPPWEAMPPPDTIGYEMVKYICGNASI